MFKRTIVPLIRINTNVYAFLSGIWISLATNIFTSLCFIPFVLKTQWHQYLASLFFSIAGAASLIVSIKVSKLQDYISERSQSKERLDEYILAFTEGSRLLWCVFFVILVLSILIGIVMLSFNLIINPPVLPSD
jgi:hypothetical protein